MEFLSNPEVWLSLFTLTFMEIVLGIDNIIFISIAVAKLPESMHKRATNIGMVLAMIFRIILLFGISWLIAMQEPWFHIGKEGSWIYGGFSGQSVILLVGGLFLLYKATTEIHHKLEGESNEEQKDSQHQKSGGKSSFSGVIFQICLINIVFSFDSILTAVGMTNGVPNALIVMIVAVVISMVIMMIFAVPVGRFVNKHPSVQMLGLSFLILIGFMLIAEGAHMAHFEMFSNKIGAIPKGYLYFAIFFSMTVEFLNMRLRKGGKSVVELKQHMEVPEKA